MKPIWSRPCADSIAVIPLTSPSDHCTAIGSPLSRARATAAAPENMTATVSRQSRRGAGEINFIAATFERSPRSTFRERSSGGAKSMPVAQKLATEAKSGRCARTTGGAAADLSYTCSSLRRSRRRNEIRVWPRRLSKIEGAHEIVGLRIAVARRHGGQVENALAELRDRGVLPALVLHEAALGKGTDDDGGDSEPEPEIVHPLRGDVIVESAVVVPGQNDGGVVPFRRVADRVDDRTRPLLAVVDAAARRMLAVEIIRLDDRQMAGPALGQVFGQSRVEIGRAFESRLVIAQLVDHVDIADAGFIVEKEAREQVQRRRVLLLQYRPRQARLLELDRKRGRDLGRREVVLLVCLIGSGIQDLEIMIVVGVGDRSAGRCGQRVQMVRKARAELRREPLVAQDALIGEEPVVPEIAPADLLRQPVAHVRAVSAVRMTRPIEAR